MSLQYDDQHLQSNLNSQIMEHSDTTATMHNTSTAQFKMVNGTLYNTKHMCISQARRVNQVPLRYLGESDVLDQKIETDTRLFLRRQ